MAKTKRGEVMPPKRDEKLYQFRKRKLEEGYTVRQIADLEGVKYTTIYRYLYHHRIIQGDIFPVCEKKKEKRHKQNKATKRMASFFALLDRHGGKAEDKKRFVEGLLEYVRYGHTDELELRRYDNWNYQI